MAMESFRKAAGLDMKMVPFGGGASEVVAALLGKHVDVAVMHPQEAGEHAVTGTLKPLTVFAEKRIKTMPNVPTAKEKGFNVVMGVTKGISGPAGLPDDIAVKLHDTFKKVMDDPEFKAAAKKTGDLDYLEERYSSLKIPYVIRRVVDDYIACLESRDERYADMSYVAGMGDAISLLTKMGMLNNQEQPLSINAE